MARPHFFLAEDFAAAGRPPAAIAAYLAGLANDSTFTTGYVRLAQLYTESAQPELAEQAFLRACDLEPERGELWGHLGAHYRSRAQSEHESPAAGSIWWEHSLGAYERAVRYEPADTALLNNLGNTYQVLGRLDDALASHERAARLAPDDAQTWHNLGNDHQYLHDLESARAAYQRAVTVAPDYPYGWLSLAMVEEATFDTLAAIRAYTRAAQLGARFADGEPSIGERVRSLRGGT